MATATDKSTTKDASLTFELPSVEEATQGFRALNEQLVESSKSAARS